MPSTSDLVENLFTRNRIHLIFGPPSSGRSTLLHQIMWDWANGREILGNKSHPSNYCLIDAIRPLSEIRAQLQDLSYPLVEIPHMSLMESVSHEARTLDSIFAEARKLIYNCPVIFLDGLQSLFHGNLIHYREVLNFTIDLSNKCRSNQTTVIATLNTAKSLEGSSTPILQRIMGSTAWLETAGTKIHISPNQGQELEAARTVTVFTPRRKPQQLNYIFTDTGSLELQGDATLHPEMDAWLQQITPGSDITSQDILDAGETRGVARATCYRWIKQQLELHALELLERGTRQKPGTYRKPPNTIPN